jgi:hypothetical protein
MVTRGAEAPETGVGGGMGSSPSAISVMVTRERREDTLDQGDSEVGARG